MQSFQEEGEVAPKFIAHSKLFELAEDYLKKLSYYDNFISDVASKDSEVQSFLTFAFSLLRELGGLSGQTFRINSLISVYKAEITKNEKDFSEKELDALFNSDYKGDGEWVDELNYIYVWALNTYQLNLKTCSVEDIKGSLNNPELELELKSVEALANEAEKSSKKKKGLDWTKNGFAVYRNLFSSKFNFGDSKNGDFEDGFEQIVSRTQAIERLERDIRGGKIYIYSSKPTRNLKIKKILSYIFLSGLVVSGIAFLKTFITCVSNGCQENQAVLFSIMSFIFFLLARNENNKYSDNENFKYSFSRRIFYYYFFLSSFFIFNKAEYSFLTNGSNGSDPFHTAILGLLVLLVVISISYFTVAFFFLNPKKNKALIKGLLQKYSNPAYLHT